MTQNELADATGLSTVHVNRVLQDLRAEGLIVLRGGSLSIPDWEALQEAAEFDPTYLQLKR
jgi:DNA-binding transcriptional regulator LsrR (DeoR family)